MPFDDAEAAFNSEVPKTPLDQIAEDYRETLKSLRAIVGRKKSRSFGSHSVDDAAMEIRKNSDYSYVRVVPAKLNDAGQNMLGPDWEAK